MTEVRYYAGVAVLQELTDVEAATEAMNQGWELLAIKERTMTISVDGKPGIATTPCYILGSLGKVNKTESKAEGNQITLEVNLEGLSWKQAKSGKCDFVRDAPLNLIESVRAVKGGFRGEHHRFTASKSEPTFFRFEVRKDP